MGKWEEFNIEKLFKIKSGNFIKRNEVSEEGLYPVFGGNGITGFTKDFNLEGENIIIGRVGAKCGNTRLINGKIWLTDNAFYISEYFKDFDKTFLRLFLEHFDLGTTANQAAQPVISYKSIKEIKIPLPPLPEQQRIVAKLDGLFAKIDQAISLLEANLQHTQALMGSVLDEEFGKLDCEKKSLKELVLKTKTANPKKDFPEDEFTYIDISSVNKELNHIEEPKNLLGKDAPSRARKVIQKEDVVFATTRPNLKNIAIVSETFDNPIASTGFCVLRVDKEILNNEYLFYFLISDLVQEYIQPFIRGAQYPAISDKDLLSLKIPFLPIKEQEVKVARIKNTFKVSKDLIKTQTKKLNHLKALKSSLLDQAFKGEL